MGIETFIAIAELVLKHLLKRNWDQELDRVYQSTLKELSKKDDVRKSEYVHKFAHFSALEQYITKGELNASTEKLVLLLFEKLNNDPITHSYLSEIRIDNINEIVSHTQEEINMIKVIIKDGFLNMENLINLLSNQNRKIIHTLNKKHFLKLYNVPVEPTSFIERRVYPHTTKPSWDYQETTLLSLCQGIETENNRFVILSSGGLGKSTELQYVAYKLAQSELYYPIYYPLRNYIVADSLSTSLPEYWDYDLGEKVLIFFDGLDEIPLSKRDIAVKDIQQIANNHPEITIVVTCRNNFYNDDLKYFECFFLNSFTMEDIREYVEFKGVDHELFFAFLEKNKLVDYSTNPFFLQAIIKFYDANKDRVDVTRKDIIDYLIEASYKTDNKLSLDTDFYKGKEMLTKLAWVMQLSEVNTISEEDVIRYIASNQQGIDILRSFSVVKVDSENNFYFEHNSIKELLVARLLVSETFEDIHTFICYKGTEIIKPSWYNTSIMLLSFMETDKPVFQKLTRMLLSNNPKILLKSERFKLPSDMRYELVHKLWDEWKEKFVYMDSSEIEDLASFGSDVEFINFCLQEAMDKNNSNTIRANACLLLAKFEYRGNYADTNTVIQSLTGILADKTEDIATRQSVLMAFSNNFLKTQINFEQIYTILKEDAILLKDFICIIPHSKVEDFISIIIDNIELFGSRQERGTNYMANYYVPFDLLGCVTSENGLLTLVGFLANNCSHLSYESQDTYDELVLQTLKNAEPYLNSSSNLLDAILNLAFEESKMSLGLDKKYVAFFSKGMVNDLVFTKLCNTLNASEDRVNHYYAVGTLVNKQNFDAFIDELTIDSLKILSDSIYDHDIKWQFKDQITIRKGIEFDQSMRYNQANWVEEEKRNFDILFNIDEFRDYLFSLIEGKEQMTWSQFLEMQRSTRQITNSIFVHFVGKFVFRDLKTREQKIDISSLRSYLNDELAYNNIAMVIVYNEISKNSNIVLSEAQMQQIHKWVDNTLLNISEPLDILRISLKLTIRFDFNIDREAALKLLIYYGSSWLTNDEWAEFMQKAIMVCSLDAVKTKIRANFKSKLIYDFFVYKSYVNYIEEHKLYECYSTAFDDLQDASRFGDNKAIVQDLLIKLLCNDRQYALKVWKVRSEDSLLQLKIDISETILNTKKFTLDESFAGEILTELIGVYKSEELSGFNKQRIILLMNAYGRIEGVDWLIETLKNNEYHAYSNLNFDLNYSDIKILDKYLMIMHEIVQGYWYTDWYKSKLLEAVMSGIKNLAIVSEENRKKIESDLTKFISEYEDKGKVYFLYKLIDDCNNLFREKLNTPFSIYEAMVLWPLRKA